MLINIKPDPDFERLRRTLLLQGKADRVPLFDFNIHESIKKQIIQKPLTSVDDEIDFWLNSGYDYVQVRLKPKSYVEAASKSVTTSHGSVKSLEQLNNSQFEWTPIFKNTWKLEDYNYEYLESLVSKLPKSMKLIVHAADIFTRSWTCMGFEDFCYAVYEDTDLIVELLKQNAIAEERMLEVLVQSFANRVGAIFYSDDIAYAEGLMLSPAFYREYLWTHIRKIIKISKQLDVPFIYHTDGKLWELFDDFAEMGINGIQPLEPKSMDLVELKEKRGHQFCLMGGIDIDRICRGTPEEVEQLTREKIELLGYNGGYTVGTSNTVPDYINADNYRVMIETAFKYGKY